MGASAALSRDKREAILDGAAAVFAAHGYEGASMSMITAAAGVSKGTIYQHFAGKAALFGATVARECERSLAPLFQDPATLPDLAEALRDIGTRLVAMLTSPEGPGDRARGDDGSGAFSGTRRGVLRRRSPPPAWP